MAQLEWYKIIPANRVPKGEPVTDSEGMQEHLNGGPCPWDRCGRYISGDKLSPTLMKTWNWHDFERVSEDEEIVLNLQGSLAEDWEWASHS